MKKILAFTLIGVLTLSTATVAFGATQKAVPTSSTIYVNGKQVDFDAYNIDGNNYFKIRDVASAINGTEGQFEVNYDSADKSVKLQSNKAYTTVGGELSKGSGTTQNATDSDSNFYMDGNSLELTSFIIGGNNYTKLRDIADIFGFSVGWEKTSSSVVVISSDEYKERDAAYTEAGLTEYQKTAAENYVKSAGMSVEDAIARTKEKVPSQKPGQKPAPKPEPAPQELTNEAVGWVGDAETGFAVDKDGFPLTGALSKAAIIANGGNPDDWGLVGVEGCYSSGTAEGDRGFQ